MTQCHITSSDLNHSIAIAIGICQSGTVPYQQGSVAFIDGQLSAFSQELPGQ